ncbi:hypothetical protein LCI18_008539 [Fusarium solani-melongenae]|uniref:Uncharacterized protein n=1 Tax=Fusarium solani subsp. cucurbitae TaxID=2747967 RepID=A0ACD3Z8L6_FUSSC|nr:hypothetical protein LCI18_008539 [Fusarium solani-melongenae]
MHFVHRVDPTPDGIIDTEIPFTSHDGATVNLRRFAQSDVIKASTPQPAVLYVHGGGMVCGSVEIYAPYMARLANETNIPIFAVDYRLAPEQEAPGLTADVFFALKYLSDHAADWNIDPSRIAVMGDSAGGGLAAGAALMARDRGLSPPLAKQILVYPMLDDRTSLSETSSLNEFLSWDSHANKLGWSAALGADKAGKDDANVSIYAAPGRAVDLSALPSTYIEVGGLDLFRGECISYASRLAAAEVEVELHVWPGLPHGFDVMSKLSWAQKAADARARALRHL